MPEAPSLQLALHRRQTVLIARALAGKSDTFRRYEERYRRRARTIERVLSREEVIRASLEADVLHVGDYHTLPQAQGFFLELVRRARHQPRPLVLALECLEGRFQPLLDRWHTGELQAEAFFQRLAAARPDSLALWPSFRALLREAVETGLPILAIDLRARGPEALARRDTHAAARIAACVLGEERPRVLVLSGQFHVTPCHLPDAVSRALGGRAAQVAQRTLFQNCEAPYFELLEQGRDPLAHGAVLEGGALCAFTASPTVAQRTFLDYLEAGDAGLEASDGEVHLAVPTMVRAIALAMGLPGEEAGSPQGAPVEPAPGESLLVIPAGAHDPLEQLTARAHFSEDELRAIHEHLRLGESLYVPRARTICLASLSVHDAAEEAARHLRHRFVGARMDADRGWEQAFYARVWEEAFGFFGSRLLAPGRPCEGLASWGRTLQESTGEPRRIAAFVLAHRALEADPSADPEQLAPPRNLRHFRAASRALGVLLGDALSRAWQAGEVDRDAIRALFRDPLDAPRALYLAWSRRLLSAGSRPAAPRAPAQASAAPA